MSTYAWAANGNLLCKRNYASPFGGAYTHWDKFARVRGVRYTNRSLELRWYVEFFDRTRSTFKYDPTLHFPSEDEARRYALAMYQLTKE